MALAGCASFLFAADAPPAPKAEPGAVEKVDVKKEEPVVLPAKVVVPLSEHEQKIQVYIREAFADAGRPYFKNRKPQELYAQAAVLKGLEKNLVIQRASKSEESVRAARMEARALFDPVLTASYAHSQNDAYKRFRKGRDFKKATQLINGENVIVLSEEAQELTTIQQIVFLNPRVAQFKRGKIQASQKTLSSSVANDTFNLRIDQQLPWGPSLFLTGASVRKETFDELEGEFGRPWSSQLSANLVMPVPFTKDFGPYSTQDVSLKLADLDNQRAFWDTKTVINSTLVAIDHAYWDLTASMESLRATIENRKSVAVLVGNVAKQLEAGRTTEYGKLQIDTEFAAVKELEEGAWNRYVQSSNALANLLDYEKDLVLIPAAYAQRLGDVPAWNQEEAYAAGMHYRPELMAERVSAKSSDVLVRFQRNQNRPDLLFSATFNHEQFGDLFGYDTFTDSLSNLQNQDTRRQDYTVTYTYPVRNRGFKSAYKEAKAGADQQGVAVELSQNLVEQQIGNALVLIAGSKAKAALALEDFKLATASYEQAKQLHEAGRVTEFELTSKSRELLFADLSQVEASIEYKKAESRLLAAEGVLPFRYAEMTAPNSFERRRVKALESSQALRFFAPSATGAKKGAAGDGGAKSEAPK